MNDKNPIKVLAGGLHRIVVRNSLDHLLSKLSYKWAPIRFIVNQSDFNQLKKELTPFTFYKDRGNRTHAEYRGVQILVDDEADSPCLQVAERYGYEIKIIKI